MGDPAVGNLTASLEELSLKKQLPLRQQVQRPTLKYSESMGVKPAQILNHADLMTIRSHAESRKTYSSLSQASTTSTMSTPFRSSKPPNAPPVLNKSPSANNIAKPLGSASRGHTNPYARPLSAKDIVNDLQNLRTKKTPVEPSISSHGSSNPSGTPMFGFQMNSFMRPQSALKREAHITKSGLNASRSNGFVNMNQNKEDESSEEKKSIGDVVNQSSPNKTYSALSQKSSKASQEDDSNAIASQNKDNRDISKGGKSLVSKGTHINTNVVKADVAAHNITKTISENSEEQNGSKGDTITSSQGKVNNVSLSKTVANNASQTAHSSLAKTVTSKSETNVASGKPMTYTKPVSSIPRPGSAALSSVIKPSTPESLAKVRNLNYTPTKPYSEVMNPSATQNVLISPTPTVVSVTTKTQQTTATATCLFMDNQLGTTNKSVQGTMYYRKGTKAEKVVAEQRPAAVGAPSNPGRMQEKGAIASVSTMEDVEDVEDEESEPGIPSGERLPGDGEASLNEDDGDDDLDDDDDFGDNGMGDLEDDYGDSDGGGSDGYSIHTGSSLSRRSSSAHVQTGRKSVYGASSVDDVTSIRPATASPDKTVKPALTLSLFPNVPPTITFVGDGEKVEQLQWELRKLLKWRMSPITPNVVKGVLSRSGFRATKRNHDWLGCWGKHMKSPGFKALREFQKLNHFPGSFQIGRKDRLWRNLSRMQVHFGKKEFGFFPQTFCLPYDTKQLKRVWEDGGSKQKWIIKPPASARGIGIRVIGKWNQIPRRKPVIVQRYLSRPYLINDSKFDMRVYVYVSCYDPLRLYVYEDGLARFASMKYSSSMKSLNNKFMHLTNYSVNKKNADYQANTDENICQGHKWSLKALWNYMKRQGINTAAIWENVKDLIVKTIICADSAVNSLVKSNCKSRYCVHELFGFDILLDENLKPWVLEVNISPSLHSNSQLDVNIKGHMIRDLFNIAGFRIPDKHDVAHSHNNSSNTDFSNYIPPNPYCLDKRLFSQQLAPDERAKHAYYCQRHQDDQALQTILDIMTPDDIRILIESIDEDSRKGNFQRVFPTPSTHKYLRFFEMPRYYNLLLDQYVQRFNRMESRGIAILESFCDEAVHLECPTDNPNHQWCPPNATCLSYREPRLLSAPTSKAKEGADSLKQSPRRKFISKTNSPFKLFSSTSLSNPPKVKKAAKTSVAAAGTQHAALQSSSITSLNTLDLSPQPVAVVTAKAANSSR
ncbi:hypothetical protein CHS0354_012090 [Potamilus streckersoni]|uniref:Tubulin polyglutamylase TTLL4 n=1 Tax=Potamilus streckersoni TaxID=2493646 RepID=A0AAE0VS04_9BIVA|nr:hypothetical protein CHS0354_012090 [Potamilus streckersoni]